MEFWLRYIELQVGSTLITSDDLDIEFTVENDDKNSAGQADLNHLFIEYRFRVKNIKKD